MPQPLTRLFVRGSISFRSELKINFDAATSAKHSSTTIYRQSSTPARDDSENPPISRYQRAFCLLLNAFNARRLQGRANYRELRAYDWDL